jgi:hypothetical protein
MPKNDKVYNEELSEKALVIWQDGWGLLEWDGKWLTTNQPEWSATITDEHVFRQEIDAHEVAVAFDAEVFAVRHGDDMSVGLTIEDFVGVNRLGFIVIKRLPKGFFNVNETLKQKIIRTFKRLFK